MKYKFTLLLNASTLACGCFLFGYHLGARHAEQKERRAQLVDSLFFYQKAGPATGMEMKTRLGFEVLTLTREYESRFGCPTGTNSFAKQFADAKAVADQMERPLAPVNLLTNVSTNFSIHIKTAN